MQSVTLAAQTQMFLLACGFGFLLGILYDAFRLLRMAFFKQSVFVFFQDLFYFSVCGLLTFLFVLSMNYGEIRGYVLLGEGLGWIVYYYSLGSVVFSANAVIVKWMKKLLSFVLQSLCAPFWFIKRLVCGICKFFVRFAKKITEKFCGNLRINLKPHFDLLYNHSTARKKSGSITAKED